MSEWYSAREDTEVHHNNRSCTEGNNIESYNRRPGKGGHRLCSRCKELNAKH